MNPYLDLQSLQNDPNVVFIICLVCRGLVAVGRDSRLHKEGLCDRCSRQTDIVADFYRPA